MAVTLECYASTVIGVPPYAVSNIFKDVTSIREFGANKMISCCLIETPPGFSPVGTVRRVTFSLPMFEDTILREKFASINESPYRVCICMEYVPCSAEDAHRSPFGVEGTKRLTAASTLISIAGVSTNPNKCFLEITTTFTVSVQVSPNGARRVPDDAILREIERFWDVYVSCTVNAVEDHILSIAFPAIGTRIDAEFEKDFSEAEDVFCRWAAASSEVIPRAEAMGALEKVLNVLLYLRRDLKHQKMMNAQLRNDVAGSMAVAEEASASVAALAAAASSNPAKKLANGSWQAKRNAAEHEDIIPNPPPRLAAMGPVAGSEIVDGGGAGKSGADDQSRGAGRPEHVPFFSPGGGRRLSVPDGEKGSTEPTKTLVPIHRPPPPRFHAELLQNVLTDIGTINEREARAVFDLLDVNGKGFITAEEVALLLSEMDPLGLHEDRDGTLLHIEESRRAVGSGFFKEPPRAYILQMKLAAAVPAAVERSTEPRLPDNQATVENGTLNGQETALQELVRRHNAQKKALREELIRLQSTQMVNHYAYKLRGQLHYDEFCLMMLHLLKEY